MLQETRSYLIRDNRAFQMRLSQARDAFQIIATINAVCAERIYMLTESYAPTSEWEKVLRTPLECPEHLLLVPQMDGQVIGWCRVFPNLFTPKASHTAEVGIGLLRPFREIGIGTALMKCAIEWAAEQGLEKLTVSTFSTNQRAINLFQKVGFASTGVRYQQYRIGDNYVDEVLMERFL